MPEAIQYPNGLDQRVIAKRDLYISSLAQSFYPIFTIPERQNGRSHHESENYPVHLFEESARLPDVIGQIGEDAASIMRSVEDRDLSMEDTSVYFFDKIRGRFKSGKYNLGAAGSFAEVYAPFLRPFDEFVREDKFHPENGEDNARLGAKLNQNLAKILYYLGDKSRDEDAAVRGAREYINFFTAVVDHLSDIPSLKVLGEELSKRLSGARAQAALMRIFAEDPTRKNYIALPNADDERELKKCDVRGHTDFVVWNEIDGWKLIDSKSGHDIEYGWAYVAIPQHIRPSNGHNIVNLFEPHLPVVCSKEDVVHLRIQICGHPDMIGVLGEKIPDKLRRIVLSESMKQSQNMIYIYG